MERRYVDWSRGDHTTYDPMLMQPEWRMWLRKQRKDPPTDEELAK